ncbi:MAG: GTP 3',8-cyclase MoaA [Myxococcota bacterium]
MPWPRRPTARRPRPRSRPSSTVMTTEDQLRRPLRSLRLSVTDRCNLRCAYCMPEEEYAWLPSPDVLSFEEIDALVDRFIALGVRKVRLTGGEPLVRRDLPVLVALLAKKGLEELALTTNGVLLRQQADALARAGLQRVTISLDTLSREKFQRLTRRDQLPAVLDGIAAAREAGFRGLKLDTVLMRGVNDDELEPLLEFASAHDAELRFIEYMDVGGATRWSMEKVVPARELLARLGPVEPLPGRGSAPAERYRRTKSGQTFGVIASTTQPFCRACDRARLTADGHWFTCLYATKGVDLKAALRGGANATELEALIRSTWERRNDRGAEERLALREQRGPLASPDELKKTPHLEMHTRGG